ncbi:E3 ubiquitin-protein ligase [Iris pallida]|uniref:E3 ubiquitin-protein ligase n=1 Tax=Iris pallida TaxID=29817 RepID=A0AAX6E9L5_IRIPA|nr:E3 ubiquitin-protein ligase [Iris pallida]
MNNNEGMINIHSEARTVPLAFLTRTVVRASRARWFGFLRRVFQYQNGSRSDVGANPFNSRPWLALELAALVVQTVGIALVLAVSKKERPVWPIRIWVSGYSLGNFLSLPLLYWRYLHCRRNGSGPAGPGSDLEQQQRATTQESRNSYLMNKSRTFLELFYAIWFVMGNVWVFDARYGNFRRAPKLHGLCVALLAWNAITYSFPFLLFLLLCCCVPVISNALGYNINVASAARGASDHEISNLTHWKFKAVPDSKDHGHGSENSECCICLAKYRDKEEVRQLPCSHVFHQGCVDQWLRIISCCPLCKKELSK